MLKKNNEKRGCLASLIWIPISIIVMFCIAGYGMSQGINVPGILSGVFNVTSKGEHANTTDIGKLFGKFIPKSESSETGTSSSKISGGKSDTFRYTPLPFENHKLMVNGDLDSLGRATYGHIRLKYSDKPQDDRESKINVAPVGWHNYRFKYEDEHGKVKKAYLMNRGHLIGYQFSGLNSEIKNLVPMTRYLNAGTMADSKTDTNNPNGMLYYENALAKWLKNNPNMYLDYCVVANYTDNELIPRTVTLYWTSFDENGTQYGVELSEKGLATSDGNVSSVTLQNVSKNANINYLDGTATSNY